jgi:hypothetical protein
MATWVTITGIDRTQSITCGNTGKISNLLLKMMYPLRNTVRKRSLQHISFNKHIAYIVVSSLAQPGTYAGNDAIVAFARLHQVILWQCYMLKTFL